MKRSDFLKRMISVIGFGTIPLNSLLIKRKVYLLQCFVAGFRHYKGMDLLQEMEVNDFIELKREHHNLHDEFAIALYWQQEKIGFIPAEHNQTIARLLDAEALPILATITNLNRDVKPWENVAIAVYFLQEENKSLPPHAGYLKKLTPPEYTTAHKNKQLTPDELMTDLYENTNRIIRVPNIPDEEVRNYYSKWYPQKVMVEGVEHSLVDNDGIYNYLYNNYPVKTVKADNGLDYILFEHRLT